MLQIPPGAEGIDYTYMINRMNLIKLLHSDILTSNTLISYNMSNNSDDNDNLNNKMAILYPSQPEMKSFLEDPPGKFYKEISTLYIPIFF